MGCFDTLSVSGGEFVCSEGHNLSGEEFQTKDLGETMGYSSIAGGVFTFHDGGWGMPEAEDGVPFTGEITIYATCRQCPAFVQNGTGNVVGVAVEFEVDIADDKVTAVRRTSQLTAEFLVTEPAQSYMAGCHGPMPFAEAERFSWELRRRQAT